MSELIERFNDLQNCLFTFLNDLEDINSENFDSKMFSLNSLLGKIDEKRTYLRNNFSQDTLREKSDLFHSAIKQIYSKFDSIIEEKKKEQNRISLELNTLLNKKKLINYQR